MMKKALLAVLAAPLVIGVAQAQVRRDVPAEDPGPPFYARISRSFVVHTQDWAAVVFYRPPACVPTGFNLY
ncbi:MAG: hypothetical protein ACRESV_06380, partial [Nevskiales bacterium]